MHSRLTSVASLLLSFHPPRMGIRIARATDVSPRDTLLLLLTALKNKKQKKKKKKENEKKIFIERHRESNAMKIGSWKFTKVFLDFCVCITRVSKLSLSLSLSSRHAHEGGEAKIMAVST